MKYFFIFLLIPIALFSQNIIDPPPIVTDTTGNYDVIDPVQHKFILGWNWGSPSEKLDNALYMNFYHSYPIAGSDNNDDYADSIRISQQLGGNVIGGRPDTTIFNSQSLYLEPTINVIKPGGEIEFQPTLRNRNGAVFGFQYKNSDIRYINDPLNPDFGRVFLYKDSIPSLPAVVLDSVWPDNILKFYNDPGPINNRPEMNGKEIYLSINLKSLEPITNPNDVILTIKMRYKVWNDNANGGKGGYVDSNFVKFKNLPKVTSMFSEDTLQIKGSRGDWRGIRRDTANSLNYYDNIKEFNITAAMLDADSLGTTDSNITLSAFTLFKDSTDQFGNYIWNPLLEPDYYKHETYTEYIKNLDVQVTYHGNLNVAIDWIRLETPRARDIYDGKYDNDVYNSAKAMIDEIATEPQHGPRLMRLYGADELLPQQWGLNRYFNMLLDTLSSSETGLSNNPPGQYIHATGFKEYWTGDNIGFLNEQAAPYIDYALLRDSAYYDSNMAVQNYNHSPESLNYYFGFKGNYRRTTDINGNSTETEDYPLLDTLDSDYETFINAGSKAHKTLPFPAENWPYDSLWDQTYNKDNDYAYSLSSTQFQIEKLLNDNYKKLSRMLFGKEPWWANLWVNSEAWDSYPGLNTTSLTRPSKRPKTGEEVSLMINEPLILGAKGLLYWLKTEYIDGTQLGLTPEAYRKAPGQALLPTGQELLYSNMIGGDFIQINDPFIRLKALDKSLLRLDLFDHDSSRVYIGIKSARTQMYKLHKWINAESDVLMDLRLEAWYGKGYKEWDEWNQYSSYKYWNKSPLRRIVDLDSVRTRKLYEPKWNSAHNNNPDYESRDSSFFDITLLQDRRDGPNDLYNRKKSVYLGIQNRRTDPLIYRDSNFYQPGGFPPPPYLYDWRGELMFFSSAEMDSNVRYGGKDLWGTLQNGAWWQEKWWQRLGCREMKIPINIPVYGNGTYVLAEELGLEKLDTLGWWYADSLYHRVDTVLSGGDYLLAKLLPGQGKIIKMTYVPYFFNDPTKDTIPGNDSCYFCDIFNNFDLFNFEVISSPTEEGCCYEVSFTYTGNCTFENIPFRLIFNGSGGNTFTSSDTLNPLKDSVGTNIKYQNIVMNLDSTTGRVILGTFCVSDTVNTYKISFLAGKDKDNKFIGCDRELQYTVKCLTSDTLIKDCCENLVVKDSLYTMDIIDTQGNSFPNRYCTVWTIDTNFVTDCIYGVSVGNDNFNKELIPIGLDPIERGYSVTVCYPWAICNENWTDSSTFKKYIKMRFLGKDGTIICEKTVPVWVPCFYRSPDETMIVAAPKAIKTPEKHDSKTYESEMFNITIWPNPTTGVLSVEINAKEKTEVNINLVNNIGISLSKEAGIELNKGINERSYNLSDYSSGVYYLYIQGKDGNVALPIMLSK